MQQDGGAEIFFSGRGTKENLDIRRFWTAYRYPSGSMDGNSSFRDYRLFTSTLASGPPQSVRLTSTG